jgi:hypothetical protein
MSTKTSFKRIALVAASALAIAGFSAVPANAAGSNTLTVTATSGATAGGTTTAKTGTAETGVAQTFTVTNTVGGTAAFAVSTVTPTATFPAGSQMNLTSGKLAVLCTASTDVVCTSTNTTTGVVVMTPADVGAPTIRYSFTPDAVGIYTFTITPTGTDAVTAVTYIFTATANTGTVSSLTVSNKATSSANALVAQSLTYTNASTTIVATGTPEEVSSAASSHTGRFLAPLLKASAKPKKK